MRVYLLGLFLVSGLGLAQEAAPAPSSGLTPLADLGGFILRPQDPNENLRLALRRLAAPSEGCQYSGPSISVEYRQDRRDYRQIGTNLRVDDDTYGVGVKYQQGNTTIGISGGKHNGGGITVHRTF